MLKPGTTWCCLGKWGGGLLEALGERVRRGPCALSHPVGVMAVGIGAEVG